MPPLKGRVKVRREKVLLANSPAMVEPPLPSMSM